MTTRSRTTRPRSRCTNVCAPLRGSRARDTTWPARSWRAAREFDRERALGLLNDALDAANSIGMTKLVEEVLKAKLELQGVRATDSIMASIDIVAAGISIERPDLRKHASSDGTVAVLFSDIEGYTTLNERLGDARTQELLRAHDTLVRDAVAAHGGTVVKSAGDGYMIVFSDAKQPSRAP